MKKLSFLSAKKNEVLEFLLQCSDDGNLPRGAVNEAAIKFQVCRKSVTRVWAEAWKRAAICQTMHFEEEVKFTRIKKKHIDLELIKSLPYNKRGSIRTLAGVINIKRSTVGRWAKGGLLRAHTSAIKPELTASNKLIRLKFSLDALELDRILNSLRFKSMQNTIHIDEKWFYMKKITQRIYLAPGEDEPHRTCKSKHHIPKVMFMSAVCRPMFATDGTLLFDGKIGIFPFTHKVPAKRASKNRARGTIETKAIDSVTREVYLDCLINQILPAARAVWPSWASKVIYIQQDNAKPHILDSNPIWREAANKDGFTFILVQQPPNSPDMNVNDLGWFRTIQAIQHETATHTIDQLVNAVVSSFENLCPMKLNKVFLSLQSCMVEIMKFKGQNCYKVPHMGKDADIRADSLPLNLEVPIELVRECIGYLMQAGSVDGIPKLMNNLGIQPIEANE